MIIELDGIVFVLLGAIFVNLFLLGYFIGAIRFPARIDMAIDLARKSILLADELQRKLP